MNNLSNTNFQEIIDFIRESVFLNDEDSIFYLLTEIIRMVRIRTNDINVYASLVSEISKFDKLNQNENYEKIFKQPLIHIILQDEDVPQLLYILKSKYDFCTDKEVQNCTMKANLFFDEFNEDSILWDMPIFNNIKNKQSEWGRILDELRNHFWTKGSLGFALKYDDCDFLQKIASDTFDFNQSLPEWSQFELDEEPPSLTLLGVAAYYGSYKCFSFINVNGAIITKEIAQCALMGGNQQICSMCQVNIDKDCFPFAFRYHRDDLMKWMAERDEVSDIRPIDCILEHNFRYLTQLVEKGIDISTLEVNESGITPLILATQNAMLSVIQFLIDSGASPNACDRRGDAPLHFAVKAVDIPWSLKAKTIKLLLKNGANVNVQDSKGMTPLMHAAIASNLPTIKLLIENGADPSIPDHKGITPLKRAVNKDVFKYLSQTIEKKE